MEQSNRKECVMVSVHSKVAVAHHRSTSTPAKAYIIPENTETAPGSFAHALMIKIIPRSSLGLPRNMLFHLQFSGSYFGPIKTMCSKARNLGLDYLTLLSARGKDDYDGRSQFHW